MLTQPLRSGLKVLSLALGLLGSPPAHADYDTLRYVEFPAAGGKVDQGIVVQLHSMNRYDGDGDNDWTFKFGPAKCDSELYGRSCEIERDRFLEIFWDEADKDLRKLIGAFIRHFAKRHPKELSAVGALPTCNDHGVKGDCRKLYGQILADFKLWDKFSDHKVYRNWAADTANWDWDAGNCNEEWCSGSDFKPSAEVTLSQIDPEKELSEAAKKREQGPTIYDFFREGGTTSPSPFIRKNMLIHGMLAVDNQHPRAGIIGKIEIHPIHGIVFRNRSSHLSFESGLQSADPAPTTWVFSTGDAGKANGAITRWCPFINYVYEDWPKNRPYFSADLSFLEQAQPAKLIGASTVEIGTTFACAPMNVESKHYDANAFGLLPPVIKEGFGRCGTHTFTTSFHEDVDPAEFMWLAGLTFGLGTFFADYLPQHSFVNAGWAAHTFTPSWATEKVSSQLEVNKIPNFKADPQLFPGVPADAVDGYEAKFSFGKLPKFGKEAIFQPTATQWKLPSTAKVIATKDWIEKGPDGSLKAGGAFSPIGNAPSAKAEVVRFAILRAPKRNPAWDEYHASVSATTLVKTGVDKKTGLATVFPMRALPKNVDREAPSLTFSLKDEQKKFRIETKQVLFNEGTQPNYDLCSPNFKTRIVYEPNPRVLGFGFVDTRNKQQNTVSTQLNYEWKRGDTILGTKEYSGGLSIGIDDPFLALEKPLAASDRFVVNVRDNTAGGALEQATHIVGRSELSIPITKLVWTGAKGVGGKPVAAVETAGTKLYAGCSDKAVSTMVVKTFSTFEIDATLTIPNLSKSGYRSKDGKELPAIQCPIYEWTVEVMDAEGKWAPFPIYKNTLMNPIGYALSQGNSRLTIHAGPQRRAYRIFVKAHDAYGRSDSERMIVNNWWAESAGGAKKKINVPAFLAGEASCLLQKAEAKKKLAKVGPKEAKGIGLLTGRVSIKGGVIDPAPWMGKAIGTAKGSPSTGNSWSGTAVGQRVSDIEKMKAALDSAKP